jgi:hypothetical protein
MMCDRPRTNSHVATSVQKLAVIGHFNNSFTDVNGQRRVASACQQVVLQSCTVNMLCQAQLYDELLLLHTL